jgi:hypothetical protein
MTFGIIGLGLHTILSPAFDSSISNQWHRSKPVTTHLLQHSPSISTKESVFKIIESLKHPSAHKMHNCYLFCPATLQGQPSCGEVGINKNFPLASAPMRVHVALLAHVLRFPTVSIPHPL